MIKREQIETIIGTGKLPPQAINCEEVLIGNFISYFDNDLVKQTFFAVKPEYFYKQQHCLIIKAIFDLASVNDPVDEISVIEQLRKNGDLDMVGGTEYIVSASSKAINLINCQFYFRIIFQKYLLREIIRICHSNINDAFDETTDCFDQLDKLLKDLNELNRLIPDSQTKTAHSIAEKFEEHYLSEYHASSAIFLNYLLGWKRFDEYVTINRDKIILIAGATGHGKSAFIRLILFILLEKYEDISVFWVSLEDSGEDILRSYLSYKLFIKAKTIKNRKFKKELTPLMQEYVKKFQSFDIKIVDETVKSKDILRQFQVFCESRQTKFNILIVDNILSLGDRDDYRDLNAMYDAVMQKMLQCRQSTRALIFIIHHFNDAQDDKNNINVGYRPIMKNIKGTEAFRRIPNQVLMINKPSEYKDLISEYTGDHKKVLDKLFIVDTGKNREDKHDDSTGLIHMFAEWDYNAAEEIDIPETKDQPVQIKRSEAEMLIGHKPEKFPF